MRDVADSINRRIAHIHVRRRHVDLGAQYMLTVAKLPGIHAPEQVEVFLDAAIAVRTVSARLGQRTSVFANFFSTEAVNIGDALLDQLYRGLVQAVEIVRCMRQPVFPVKTQPVHVILDRLDEFRALLTRIRIIKTQKSAAAGLGSHAEVQADRHDVPDMQIAVRLWRESGHDFGMLTRLEVVVNDLADKIPRFAIVHEAGLYANFFKHGAIRVQLRAVLPAQKNT